ncbi:MAG: hypothetical protein BZ136_02040 [Methanosphaera sp. rholeuAM74]|nr:MAG: hypothetical protein BZ136_02040 [Methanosphaera sp. rholeuAM74]
MMMIQYKIDIRTQLEAILPSNYELVIPSIVIDELDKLARKAKGKDKITARIVSKLAEKSPFRVEKIEKADHVDNILLDYCECGDVLCTNDRRLRQRARKKGITVIYLRQYRYLEVDGHITSPGH